MKTVNTPATIYAQVAWKVLQQLIYIYNKLTRPTKQAKFHFPKHTRHIGLQLLNVETEVVYEFATRDTRWKSSSFEKTASAVDTVPPAAIRGFTFILINSSTCHRTQQRSSHLASLLLESTSVCVAALTKIFRCFHHLFHATVWITLYNLFFLGERMSKDLPETSRPSVLRSPISWYF